MKTVREKTIYKHGMQRVRNSGLLRSNSREAQWVYELNPSILPRKSTYTGFPRESKTFSNLRLRCLSPKRRGSPHQIIRSMGHKMILYPMVQAMINRWAMVCSMASATGPWTVVWTFPWYVRGSWRSTWRPRNHVTVYPMAHNPGSVDISSIGEARETR